MRRLTNGDPSTPFPMADIIALADGVPRSLPFNAVSVHFGHADFGRVAFAPGLARRQPASSSATAGGSTDAIAA